MATVCGRESELAAIRAFVDDEAAGARVLLLEGEPGVGKSTLWREGAAAAEQTHEVLRAEPVEAESKLAYAGLADLLEEVADRVLEALFPPQRRALEVALLRAEPDGAPPGRRAVGAAFLEALRVLARACSVVVGIDDVQWLDEPSFGVVAFAARRLRDEPVAFLLATRPGAAAAARLPATTTRVPVGPLAREPFAQLLRERLGTSLSPAAADRLHEASGGNAFYGLELAVALQRAPLDPGGPLAVPPSLHRLLGDRVAALSPGGREALLAVALLAGAETAVVTEALGPASGAAVAECVRAGLVEEQGHRLRPAHPLLATFAAGTATEAERRRMHARLAPAVHDEEERARHLALAATGPDEAIAAALEHAAGRALARGAPAGAAELCEQAAELSVTPPERARRLVAAGAHRFLAAEPERGEALLERALPEVAPGPERARALLVYAAGVSHEVARAERLLGAALDEAGDADVVRATALSLRSMFFGILQLRPLEAVEDAGAALGIADRLGDPDLIAQALAATAWAEALLGRQPSVPARLDGAVGEAADRQRPFLGLRRPLLAQRTWRGELDGVRDALLVLERRAALDGDEESAAAASLHLVEYELRVGNWAAADKHVRELASYADLAPPIRPIADCYGAAVASRRGDLELARTLAERGRFAAEQLGDVLFETLNRVTLGFVELSEDEPAAAVEWLEPVYALTRERGLADPGEFMFEPDLVEALLGSGRTPDAAEVAAGLERAAAEQSHPWARFVAARCSALVLAARGQAGEAAERLAESLARAPALDAPFEHARSSLALGRILRRTKRRADARSALEQAAHGFAGLGAARWLEHAEAELRRLGGRRGSEALTPAQLRVAELVVAGGSNKSVAAALFISENTVESHLRQIYAKLGVGTRTQLARRLAEAGHDEASPEHHGNP